MRGRRVRKCELTRVKQGQIKVIHWMAYTLTSVSKLLQVGAGSESQRRGEEQRPIRILSSEGFRAPAAALGLCVTPTALCPVCHKVLPACGEVNISLKSYLAPQWGVGEVGVLITQESSSAVTGCWPGLWQSRGNCQAPAPLPLGCVLMGRVAEGKGLLRLWMMHDCKTVCNPKCQLTCLLI